jgi:hypothetical protein
VRAVGSSYRQARFLWSGHWCQGLFFAFSLHDDESLSEFAASILVEVEEDEETLRSFAKKIGSGSNVFKEAAAWLTEKTSRLKLGGEFIWRLRHL